MHKPHPPGFRAWLLIAGAALLAPLLLLSVYQLVQIQHSRQGSIEQQLAQRTESAALAVASRLQTGIGYLDSLASSDAALNGDLEALYRQARRVAQKVPGLTGVGLMKKDLTMAFITAKPYGPPLPKPPSTTMAEAVFAQGKPAVSGLFQGPYSGKKVVSLGVPVFQNGEVAYCIFMVLTSESWSELLKDQHLPEDWRVGLVDQNGTIVGRNVVPEMHVGTRVVPEMLDYLKQRRLGMVPMTTKEGLPALAYIAAIPGQPWTIAMAVPDAVIAAPLRNWLILLFSTTVLIFLGIAFLACAAGKHLESWVQRVLRSVGTAKNGGQVVISPVHIRELDDMAQSLVHAHHTKQKIRADLSSAENHREDFAQQLARSHIDGLTGLWRRHGFVEEVHARRARRHAQGLAAGILFMDLDGFKAINEALGHQAGDQVLIEVGKVLHEVAGPSHVVGRWGGDEFVMCVFTPEEGLVSALQDLSVTIKRRIEALGHGLGCSIGRVAWDKSTDSLEALIDRADGLMYADKFTSGRRFVNSRAPAD